MEDHVDFIKYVENNTKEYLERIPKAERKKIGQFFTPSIIAEYMGSLSNVRMNEISILDAGAGSGILSASLLNKIYFDGKIKIVHLDVYENNSSILPLLESNLEYIKTMLSEKDILLDYKIYRENFIVENHFAWTGIAPKQKYDIVISNPPYKKIGKNDAEALVMQEIVYGQPNLYFLFMAMAARLLKENGEFIFIVPRSFSSGLYFTEFRKWFFNEMKITNMHLFVSRDSVFDCDNILQETIILRAVKSNKKPQGIIITESMKANDFKSITSFIVPYNTCVKNDINSFLFFPTAKKDIETLDFINQWDFKLSDIGYRMKTGVVVDFRETQWLVEKSGKNTLPLLWPYNFQRNQIEFPVFTGGKPQYLLDTTETVRLQMKLDNYILIKRFTTKEERKRLQCAMFFKDDFKSYKSISTENHLNFITKINGEMTKEEMYGLFVIINSTYMDKYFRILNGSTQVNANEINSVPFPSIPDIKELGQEAMMAEVLDEKICDEILENKFQKRSIRSAI